MAGKQLDRSASAIQRLSSSLKVEMPTEGKTLRPSPSFSTPKDNGIRNRNVAIGMLSTLLILAVSWHTFSPEAMPAYEMDPVMTSKWSHGGHAATYKEFVQRNLVGAQKFLVEDPKIDMKYHGGPLLTGIIKVHVIFYGSWSATQKATVTGFIKSFAGPLPKTNYPTVAGWWRITRNYKDKKRQSVAQKVVLGKTIDDKYSFKKSLTEQNVEAVVTKALKAIDARTVDPSALYVVLTSADVRVQGFCSSLCGTHSYFSSAATQKKTLAFTWVGNPSKYCPGHCAWPYAKADYGAGPNTAPLKPPNGDAGVEGMIVTLGSMMVGAATNTKDDGYYQGEKGAGYEAVAACGGIFGDGAYPGYSGKLRKTSKGASFNVFGEGGRTFLLPFAFELSKKKCVMQL